MITVERKKKSKDKLPVPALAESHETPKQYVALLGSSGEARESETVEGNLASPVVPKGISKDSRGRQSPSTGNSVAIRYPNLRPFKPGQSGNPSGRPKILTESMTKVLAMPAEIEIPVVKDGQIVVEKKIGTKAELIALRMAHEASSHYRVGCAGAQLGAADKLRSVAEPTESEEQAGNVDRELLKFMATLLMGNMKPVKTIDV